MTQTTDLLTLAQAGQVADLHPDTLRAQIHNGRLHATKLGRDWFVTRAELDRYLADRWKRPQEGAAEGGANPSQGA